MTCEIPWQFVPGVANFWEMVTGFLVGALLAVWTLRYYKKSKYMLTGMGVLGFCTALNGSVRHGLEGVDSKNLAKDGKVMVAQILLQFVIIPAAWSFAQYGWFRPSKAAKPFALLLSVYFTSLVVDLFRDEDDRTWVSTLLVVLPLPCLAFHPQFDTVQRLYFAPFCFCLSLVGYLETQYCVEVANDWQMMKPYYHSMSHLLAGILVELFCQYLDGDLRRTAEHSLDHHVDDLPKKFTQCTCTTLRRNTVHLYKGGRLVIGAI